MKQIIQNIENNKITIEGKKKELIDNVIENLEMFTFESIKKSKDDYKIIVKNKVIEINGINKVDEEEAKEKPEKKKKLKQT